MAKQVKEVRILGRYTIKHNGAIVYRVENGGGKKYCCTKQKDSSWICMGSDEQCKGQKYSKDHTCYHIEACEAYEQQYHSIPEQQTEQNEKHEAASATSAEAAEIDEEAKLERWTSAELGSLGNNRYALPAPVNAPKPIPVSREWLLGRR